MTATDLGVYSYQHVVHPSSNIELPTSRLSGRLKLQVGFEEIELDFDMDLLATDNYDNLQNSQRRLEDIVRELLFRRFLK